jgi:hypothetical protein
MLEYHYFSRDNHRAYKISHTSFLVQDNSLVVVKNDYKAYLSFDFRTNSSRVVHKKVICDPKY